MQSYNNSLNYLKEDAVKLLNNYTSDFAGATRQTWQELEHKFWEMFWTGF